jgi:hypothetical protein
VRHHLGAGPASEVGSETGVLQLDEAVSELISSQRRRDGQPRFVRRERSQARKVAHDGRLAAGERLEDNHAERLALRLRRQDQGVARAQGGDQASFRLAAEEEHARFQAERQGELLIARAVFAIADHQQARRRDPRIGERVQERAQALVVVGAIEGRHEGQQQAGTGSARGELRVGGSGREDVGVDRKSQLDEPVGVPAHLAPQIGMASVIQGCGRDQAGAIENPGDDGAPVQGVETAEHPGEDHVVVVGHDQRGSREDQPGAEQLGAEIPGVVMVDDIKATQPDQSRNDGGVAVSKRRSEAVDLHAGWIDHASGFTTARGKNMDVVAELYADQRQAAHRRAHAAQIRRENRRDVRHPEWRRIRHPADCISGVPPLGRCQGRRPQRVVGTGTRELDGPNCRCGRGRC